MNQGEGNHSRAYVLATAAYNEGKLIEGTIQSMISQRCRPAKWIIVSDASTDNTDEIVSRYAAQYDFIQLLRLTDDHPRNFAAQAIAINAGIERLEAMDYDFIGNLDADVTLEPSYFERLLAKFDADPQLGLGGGAICEKCPDGVFRGRPGNSVSSVAHAVQLFRKACFEMVGSRYALLPYGGPDTFAEVSARKAGWRVESFEDLPVFHHRPTGSAGGVLRGYFRQGKMDYSLGTLPSFEILKVLKRFHAKPRGLGAAARLAGFLLSYCRREKRAVSNDFISYFRKEQGAKMRGFFRKGTAQ